MDADFVPYCKNRATVPGVTEFEKEVIRALRQQSRRAIVFTMEIGMAMVMAIVMVVVMMVIGMVM